MNWFTALPFECKTTDLEETVAEVAKTREKGVTLKALQDAINAVKAAAEKYLAKSRLGMWYSFPLYSCQ